MNWLPDDIFGHLLPFINRSRDCCSVCRVSKRWCSVFHLKHVLWRDIIPASPLKRSLGNGNGGGRPPPFGDAADYLIPRLVECATLSITLVSPFRIHIPHRLLEDLGVLSSLQQLHFNDYVVLNPSVCTAVANLAKMPSLTQLSVYFACLKKKECPSEDLSTLFDVFTGPKLHIVDINFLSCGITDSLVTTLVDRLFHSSVHHLTLSLHENRITDAGSETFQLLTTHQSKFQKLEIQLQGCGFTADLRTPLTNGHLDFFSTAEIRSVDSWDGLGEPDDDDQIEDGLNVEELHVSEEDDEIPNIFGRLF